MNYVNHYKIIFMSSYKFFYIFLHIEKCSKCLNKDSSEKYQNDKERIQKRAHERYQSLSKEEKEKKATIWSKTKDCLKNGILSLY